jgi:hypothetical protein
MLAFVLVDAAQKVLDGDLAKDGVMATSTQDGLSIASV